MNDYLVVVKFKGCDNWTGFRSFDEAELRLYIRRGIESAFNGCNKCKAEVMVLERIKEKAL